MRKITVADAETDPFRRDDPARDGRFPEPFLWGFYDGKEYHEFEDTERFIHHIEDKNIICYFHNGGKFDFHFLLNYVDCYTDLLVINGRIVKMKIGECELRDSYAILPTPLAAFQKTVINYDRFEAKIRRSPQHWDAIRSYLKDDCTDLYKYVKGFIDEFGIHITQATAAIKTWQKITGIKAPNDYGGFLYTLLKKYYYGGRCQSFVYGIVHKPFKLVDINSAYPFAMLSDHPLGTRFIEIDAAYWYGLDDEAKGPVLLSVTGIARGCFPYRGADDSLYFPDDDKRRTYHITGWELLTAIDTDTLEDWRIECGYYFPEKANFKDYINHFYERRKQAKKDGDIKLSLFCKLLMNSLYGKFGSNPDKYRNVQTAPRSVFDENGEAGEWTFSGLFGPWALAKKELDEDEKRFYNVATAASITGFVRAYLWRAICRCNGVLYCDTDSIAAHDVGDLPNGLGDELGQWDIEGEFSGGAFGGKKLYAMRYDRVYRRRYGLEHKGKKLPLFKMASKGVKLKPRDFYTIARGGEVIYAPENPVYSVHKPPHFQNRRVKMNIKTLPE